MSKAILEFDLTDPDDQREHLRCVKSTDLALALWEIRTRLREKCQDIADSKNASEDVHKGIELVFDQVSDVFEHYNINVDELII